MRSETAVVQRQSTGLVEILDRILDKGLVIAGDIEVLLADIELLTIRIRLIICSLDKAEKLGIDWWRHDRHLTSGTHRPGKGSVERSDARRHGGGSIRRQSVQHGAVQVASGRQKSRRS